MNIRPAYRDSNCRRFPELWLRRLRVALAMSAFVIVLLPISAEAHPQTRQGFFVGLGLGTGSADMGEGNSNSSEGGSGGSLRFGYALNPRFAIGFEGNSWVHTEDVGTVTLGTFTAAVSVFPVEGLVLRGGFGGGDAAGMGDGLSGEVGTGWTLGAAYEFRVTRTFAIGPQIDHSQVNLSFTEPSFTNIGFLMTWYFIPN